MRMPPCLRTGPALPALCGILNRLADGRLVERLQEVALGCFLQGGLKASGEAFDAIPLLTAFAKDDEHRGVSLLQFSRYPEPKLLFRHELQPISRNGPRCMRGREPPGRTP